MVCTLAESAFIVSGRCRLYYTYRIVAGFSFILFFLLSALIIWKKETYAYETATDLIRFQLHGWAQSSTATDAPYILSQIRETSCIHEYDEYANKGFIVIRMHIILISIFIIKKQEGERAVTLPLSDSQI